MAPILPFADEPSHRWGTRRITLLATTLDGGIGRNIVNLATAWSALGVGVQIIAENEDGPYWSQAYQHARDVKRLRTTHAVLGIPGLFRALRPFDPDYVISPTVRLTVLALRTRSFCRGRFRVAANVHNTYSRMFERLDAGKRARRMSRISRYYARCDRVIGVSRGVSMDFTSLTGFPPERIDTIHNPVLTRNLLESARMPVPESWFNESASIPVILNVGRLERQKDLITLVSAFEIVRARRTCRLAFIGEGRDRARLETRIAQSPFGDDIALLGHSDNPYAYMARASVFVLSSLWEGFGNVLVEAMACGTPVVSTDCPHGPREILEDGRLGPLVPPENPDAMADAISRTLDHPPSASLLMQAANHYHVDRIARKYLEVLFP
jgi:glycosyltransferase involved in cell wall biosynthesis